MADIVEMVTPLQHGATRSFDATKPQLASIELKVPDMCRTFISVTMTYLLSPLVLQGEAKKDIVLCLCQNLSKECTLASNETDILLQNALEDVGSTAKALVALLDPASTDAGQLLEELTKAKKGAKQLLKQSLLQSDFWRERELAVRKCEVAMTSLSPKLKELEEKLQKEPGDEARLKEALTMLPKFQACLRPGAADGLLLQIVDVLLLTSQKAPPNHMFSNLAQRTNPKHTSSLSSGEELLKATS